MAKFKVCYDDLVMCTYKYRIVGYRAEISNDNGVLYSVDQAKGYQLWKKLKADLIKEWGPKGFYIKEE